MIFSAQGQGKISLTINGKPVLDLIGDLSKKASEPIRLGKGKNHVVAVYQGIGSRARNFDFLGDKDNAARTPAADGLFTRGVGQAGSPKPANRQGRFCWRK